MGNGEQFLDKPVGQRIGTEAAHVAPPGDKLGEPVAKRRIEGAGGHFVPPLVRLRRVRPGAGRALPPAQWPG